MPLAKCSEASSRTITETNAWVLHTPNGYCGARKHSYFHFHLELSWILLRDSVPCCGCVFLRIVQILQAAQWLRQRTRRLSIGVSTSRDARLKNWRLGRSWLKKPQKSKEDVSALTVAESDAGCLLYFTPCLTSEVRMSGHTISFVARKGKMRQWRLKQIVYSHGYQSGWGLGAWASLAIVNRAEKR
jgi:hypothetical protein